MTSILIVEDEPPAARRLARLAGEGVAGAQICHVGSLREAFGKLDEQSFDIICLDLNLAGDDGFKALSHTAAKGAAIIVVSAHLERALEGFDHGVVDFVPKPVVADRFLLALTRAHEARQTVSIPRLAFRRTGGIDLVSVGEIVSISGAGDYAEIQTLSGASYLDDRNLSDLETLLSGHLLRVHRSYLVNLNFVERLAKDATQSVLELQGGFKIPVARRALAKVMTALPNLAS